MGWLRTRCGGICRYEIQITSYPIAGVDLELSYINGRRVKKCGYRVDNYVNAGKTARSVRFEFGEYGGGDG